MKALILILILFITTISSAQFAIVSDKDGKTNIRKSAGKNSPVIDVVADGEIVCSFEPDGDWIPVDYDLVRNNKSGYIHKSRLRYIDDLAEILKVSLEEKSVLFRKDDLEIRLMTRPFFGKEHKLVYGKSGSGKSAFAYLQTIDGTEIWGTDGGLPTISYESVVITQNGKTLKLPVENLFEPNLDYTHVSMDDDTYYISALNGNGAGGYAVLWVVSKNLELRKWIKTIPF